jgi:hypothetical protein
MESPILPDVKALDNAVPEAAQERIDRILSPVFKQAVEIFTPRINKCTTTPGRDDPGVQELERIVQNWHLSQQLPSASSLLQSVQQQSMAGMQSAMASVNAVRAQSSNLMANSVGSSSWYDPRYNHYL